MDSVVLKVNTAHGVKAAELPNSERDVYTWLLDRLDDWDLWVTGPDIQDVVNRLELPRREVRAKAAMRRGKLRMGANAGKSLPHVAPGGAAAHQSDARGPLEGGGAGVAAAGPLRRRLPEPHPG